MQKGTALHVALVQTQAEREFSLAHWNEITGKTGEPPTPVKCTTLLVLGVRPAPSSSANNLRSR